MKRVVWVQLRLVRCPRCNYVWWYKGLRKSLYITCPKCLTKSRKELVAVPKMIMKWDGELKKWRIEV